MGKVNKILVIVGPTGCGKSDLAYKIACKIKSEIVSADSRQIYKVMDIGTAKPSLEIRNKIKHHFVDELDLTRNFSAGDFLKEGREIIKNIFSKNKLPIIVGGTGLYIDALINGLILGANRNNEIRNEILNTLEKYGSESIFKELEKVDPVISKKYNHTQTRFVVRALEVFYSTGIPISEHHKNQEIEKLPANIFALDWDRKILYDRINNRVDKMLENGFLNEVKYILKHRYDEKLPSLNTVGYKEAIEFLKNIISENEFIRLMKQNSRRYAKRQLTWFRRNKNIQWYKISNESDLDGIAENILKYYK